MGYSAGCPVAPNDVVVCARRRSASLSASIVNATAAAAVAAAARGLAGGDLTRRANVSGSDEIGVLARTFNTMAERLQRLYGDRADVIHGDGTDTGLPDAWFTSVVCFTMLHHVPTVELQDRLFAEAFRVLTPGGVFAGSDGRPSLPFRLLHIGDVYNPVAPDDLRGRLSRAGFSDIHIDVAGSRQRWRATKAA